MTDTIPPYRRIAADLRRRITSGELRPGDRVPSARQLTRDWGVAIATATKALAVLRQEGLTTASPGTATVVAGRPSRPGRPGRDGAGGRPGGAASHPTGQAHDPGTGDGGATRQRIVRAAIAIADAEGMAELSMRRIAAELGVATMSLYRHVPGKDDLILLMIDATLGEERLPARPPDGWRARLEVSARLQWALFRRHPWLAPAFSLTRPQFAPNAMAHAEWVLRAFDGTRATLDERMYVHLMLFSFVRGVATALEAEVEAERETGLTSDEWMQTQEGTLESVLTSNTMPGLQRLSQLDDFDFDLDRVFTVGLERFLDGLALHLRRSTATAHRPPDRPH